MDNIAATIPSQTSLNTGNPLNPQPVPPLASEPATISTIESIVSSPLEPVPTTVELTEKTNVDGNVQAHVDVNYQAHDVALAAATTKTNGHQPSNGFTGSAPYKMDIDDGDEHPDKVKSCCLLLNKLFLAAAIVCFALFLCSIAYIVATLEGLNPKPNGAGLARMNNHYSVGDGLSFSEELINESYFNLTHPSTDGIIVVLARRGASIVDVLLPLPEQNRTRQYRSIVLKGGNENHFGSIRFGFDNPLNTMNMTNQLPQDYIFLNHHNEEWSMFANPSKPYRVRFMNGLIQVIYEFSVNNRNEFSMTTMVAAQSNQEIIADPTNNVYFNLRSYGDLSTHNLNLSSSIPMNVSNGQKMEQGQLIQSQRVDRLLDVNNYFYKLDRAGIGKNYVATLTDSETKTSMHVFSDHAGVTVDPHGVGLPNQNVNPASTIPDMRGVRISPRQSPVYGTLPIYGPTSIVYPSQAIHTTWWQFNY